jgi:hypothetical protein
MHECAEDGCDICTFFPEKRTELNCGAFLRLHCKRNAVTDVCELTHCGYRGMRERIVVTDVCEFIHVVAKGNSRDLPFAVSICIDV